MHFDTLQYKAHTFAIKKEQAMENPFQMMAERLEKIENAINELAEKMPKKRRDLMEDNTPEPVYISKKTAAGLLSCSPQTIENYCRQGRLTRHYVGKNLRLKKTEILALLENRDSPRPRRSK